MTQDTLNALYDVIVSRKDDDPSVSYSAKLFKKGTKKITKKIGEESAEVIIAALAEGREDLVAESADLLFHLLVLWAKKEIHPDEVMKELERRKGISGIVEKNSRPK